MINTKNEYALDEQVGKWVNWVKDKQVFTEDTSLILKHNLNVYEY